MAVSQGLADEGIALSRFAFQFLVREHVEIERAGERRERAKELWNSVARLAMR